MTFKGPFRPKLFYDSMNNRFSAQGNASDTCCADAHLSIPDFEQELQEEGEAPFGQGCVEFGTGGTKAHHVTEHISHVAHYFHSQDMIFHRQQGWALGYFKPFFF